MLLPFFQQALDSTHFSYIQPPPPGYAPTVAQQAYAQGQQVHVTRQKKDMWGGGSDGGMTIW